MPMSIPSWFADAVVYEIYPQSFRDSNGDGIGDLRGVIEKLDYIESLGIDVIWFNPCFASPFRDAGYDVSDYRRIAPRYGDNDDMIELVEQAGARGIRVLLDLVAGHTSREHPWFLASSEATDDDRYIWADRPQKGFVANSGTRGGWYLKNFFDEQPALNFGYARLDPSEPWRQLPDAPGPRRNIEALRETIAFWLDRGIAGFRVDMAYSLVKDDRGLIATAAVWRELTTWLAKAYPEAVLVPETDEERTADAGLRAGFHADFCLVIQREHSALFNNGATGVLPWQEAEEPCYFDADVEPDAGAEALERFLALWNEHRETAGDDRLVILPSSDHDFSRLLAGTRRPDQLRSIFTFLLTWGSIPSLYYGDEIGMRNLQGLPETEGSRWNSGYDRSGCRTPMQWDARLPNDGFSDGPSEALYLPQDSDPSRPTVAAQLADPDSLLRFVRRLIRLRRAEPELSTASSRTLLHIGYPFVYLRGDHHLVAMNPRRDRFDIALDVGEAAGRARLLIGSGIELDGRRLSIDGYGHGVFELKRAFSG